MLRASRVAWFALAVAGSVGLALLARTVGSALHDLRTAHRTATGPTFDVFGEPWLGETVVWRYRLHAEHCHLRPPIRQLTNPDPRAFRLDSDGTWWPPR